MPSRPNEKHFLLAKLDEEKVTSGRTLNLKRISFHIRWDGNRKGSLKLKAPCTPSLSTKKRRKSLWTLPNFFPKNVIFFKNLRIVFNPILEDFSSNLSRCSWKFQGKKIVNFLKNEMFHRRRFSNVWNFIRRCCFRILEFVRIFL